MAVTVPSRRSRVIKSVKVAPSVSSESPRLSRFRIRATGWRLAARLAAAVLLAGAANIGFADTQAGAALPALPDQLYGELFVAVQTGEVYSDQKTFVDATPNADPAVIVQAYRQQKGRPGFSLASFVHHYFTPSSELEITPPPNQSLRDHINWLWTPLTRTTTSAPPNSSLIPLPKPYVVPGGRFREGYYWDTYFTMLGPQQAGREDLVDGMLDNFAYEIDTFGHIPNGNRTYYLSRSQPPFFAYMVDLAARREGDRAYRKYLPQLRKEYAYWMQGARNTPRGGATRRVVVMRDGAVLNRYWDDVDTPRPESYVQDRETARQAPDRPANEVFRDLRAAAESGWDFSSRWFGDNATLATIRTTAIVPVDLNSLMYHLETTIAKGCGVQHDTACVHEFTRHAAKRAEAINMYLWNPKGYYGDYDWKLAKPRDNRSPAMLYPLYAGATWPDRAKRTAQQVREVLLKPGGLVTTADETDQQWDAPNGWAPLQWIAIEGLTRYKHDALARQIGTRFLSAVKGVYASQHKLVEKYVVAGDDGMRGGGGGEYPLQDGFGWTNAVTLKLLDAYGPGQ